jgi:membrane protease YdiL (CAAX protease family)
MPYADPGERARIWHPIILLLGSFVVFYLWASVPTIVLVLMDHAAGRQGMTDPASLTMTCGLPALGAAFLFILVHFLLWTRLAERRPLTSIGLFVSGAGGQYTNGLVYGAMFALLINLLAILGANRLGFDVPELFTGSLGNISGAALLFAAAIVPVVLVQAGTEEVVFRGWMLSSLSARTSITTGILVSSVAFGVFHLDRFLIDPTFAIIFISSTVVLGAFLGVWAVRAKSIAGPAGFHGAYNGLLFVSEYLDGAAHASPGDPATKAWAKMMSMESMQDAVKNIDYLAVMQSAEIICALIGIVALLAWRRDETDA